MLIVLTLLARRELVVRELKMPPVPRKKLTVRFVVLKVDTARTLLTIVRGAVRAIVETDVRVMDWTLERLSCVKPSI